MGEGSTLDVIERTFFPHSLGVLFLAITQYLGFMGFGDEFKVMGLAPYGSPDTTEPLRKLLHLQPGGRFALEPLLLPALERGRGHDVGGCARRNWIASTATSSRCCSDPRASLANR